MAWKNGIPPEPNNTGRKVAKLNALSLAHLVSLLLEGTRNCRQLSEETGLHYITVRGYCRALHDLQPVRAAYIASWQRDSRGRANIKCYKLGRFEDAPRPAMTSAERNRRSRAHTKPERTARANGRRSMSWVASQLSIGSSGNE